MLKAAQAYCYEEVQNYEKFSIIQSIVENGWWGGDAPLTVYTLYSYMMLPPCMYRLLLTVEPLSVSVYSLFSVPNKNLGLEVMFLQNLQGVSSLVYLIVIIIL